MVRTFIEMQLHLKLLVGDSQVSGKFNKLPNVALSSHDSHASLAQPGVHYVHIW